MTLPTDSPPSPEDGAASDPEAGATEVAQSNPSGASQSAEEIVKGLLEQVTPEVVERLLSGPQVTAQVTALFSHFSGPLPPPETLAGYDRIMPGLANRIVEMAEAYQRHQIGLERDQFKVATESGRRGQWLGFGVAFVGFAVTAYLGSLGQPVAAGVVAALDLGSIVTVFVVGDRLPLRRARGRDAEPGDNSAT